jgi:DNA gyrase inhibitor GyrI
MQRWASSKGLLDNPKNHPLFGFNNPNPSPGRAEYGYELWIRVDPGFEDEGQVEMKEFAGGIYAFTQCRLVGDPSGSVVEIWKKLWGWAQASERYKWRRTHELEQLQDPLAAEKDMLLNLYLPVEERTGSSS